MMFSRLMPFQDRVTGSMERTSSGRLSWIILSVANFRSTVSSAARRQDASQEPDADACSPKRLIDVTRIDARRKRLPEAGVGDECSGTEASGPVPGMVRRLVALDRTGLRAGVHVLEERIPVELEPLGSEALLQSSDRMGVARLLRDRQA